MLLSALAVAAEGPEVRPWGFVRPAFVYVQDNDAIVTDQDGFTLQTQLGLDASYRPAHIGIRVAAEFLPAFGLTDAVLTWQPIPHFRLDAGQYKVPLAIHTLASDTRRLLPTTPHAVAEVATRDLGVSATGFLVIGEKSWFQYTSGVFNGEGPNHIQNVNQRFLLAQRALVTPFGARPTAFEGSDGGLYLGVGGAWTWNVLGSGETAEEVNNFGAELQFAWTFLSVQGEFLTGTHAYANEDLVNYSFLGWYGQVGAFVPVGWFARHLELVARVGQNDPDVALESSLGEQIGPAAMEITGGINVYAFVAPDRFHDVKIQVAYSRFQELEGGAADNDKLVAMGVARF